MALLVEYHDDAAVHKEGNRSNNKTKKRSVDDDEWTQANGVRYI